ncbi:C-type lectin LmsL-like [Sebastes umbrosus]|uniref:C-type lectin LmsL-like n=1 Tax=Sebastes umbrosus TaxID=72105 RepID=UPI00189D66FE|nr:C-type lectin LmsL-like [Sebastes umbrosus]XP_037608807.1 C-type lectin LmsL-like [Sebastes umbrosus]
MRPVVVTAILLLVVLMSMSASAYWYPNEMCKTKYKTPCNKDIGGDNWFQMDNRCVKAFHDNAHLSFDDAEKACNQHTSGNSVGHLVSIHSVVELCQVECAMLKVQPGKAHYWIGLQRKWVIVDDDDAYDIMVWTDGTKSDYSHWAGWQPDNLHGEEMCVEMNYWEWGLWNDEKCWQRKAYVCAVRVS